MVHYRTSLENLKITIYSLFDYCRTNDWAGYDPYDALNSKIFMFLPFLDFRFFRLVLTQLLKRSPINIRQLLLIPKVQNPKALALFLMALLKLSRIGLLDHEDLIQLMIEKIESLRAEDTPYCCWGYSFPWQTRKILVPRSAPNLICTSFVANSLLDAYESNGEQNCLNMAISAAEYILKELYWIDGNFSVGLAYPLPFLRSRVHNANFIGAALLCRIYKLTGNKIFLDPALKVAQYSAAQQQDDGSWDYGESSLQHWIDNFHTGYNLCALRTIGEYADTSKFEDRARRGFAFYKNHFFRKDGAPKYFHNQIYPIDIHCVAQSIITLLRFKDIDNNCVNLSLSVFQWAMTHMWDGQGFFYYQIYPLFKIKTSYMRWSQAWMLLALSTLLDELGDCRV